MYRSGARKRSIVFGGHSSERLREEQKRKLNRKAQRR